MAHLTWDEREAIVDRLARDLAERESCAQLDLETRQTLAKIGMDLNLSAEPLIRFLILMGALYVKDLDTKTLNVVRAVTDGDVNLAGPGYELPF